MVSLIVSSASSHDSQAVVIEMNQRASRDGMDNVVQAVLGIHGVYLFTLVLLLLRKYCHA